MANNLPAGFVLDSNPDYTTPPPSGNTGQVAADAAPPKVILDVPATGGGGLPEGFVPDAPSKPFTQPTAADLAAVQQAMNQSAPWRGIPLLGQAGGLIQDIATAKPQTPNYQPSAIPALDPVEAFTNRFVNALPVIGPVALPAAVLIRPDGHVAWAGGTGSASLSDALEAWFGRPSRPVS